MPARKILIADPDLQTTRAITKALRARGYQVQHAPDGSKALELAVLRHPDVILFDEACRLIEARAFLQILQTNPRTDDIPVVVTTASAEGEHLRQFRDGTLKKPFNLDEVLSRIDHLCRRAEAARELRGDAREIEGGLAQLPLVDLLQILAMNRRTGRLSLVNGHERGELSLVGGRLANARSAAVEGEKALYRLLGWREGSFAFAPGPAPARARLDLAMEGVVLEGMRQTDERARLLAALPALQQRLLVVPDAAGLVEPHPVTAEVLRVLAQPRKLQDVLDLAEAPDLEILAALTALIERGLVRREEGELHAEGPLLEPAEVHALRGKLMRGKPARNALVAKLIVCGATGKVGRWLLKSLAGLVPVSGDPSCLRSSFGTLGRVEMSEVLKVDLVLVPTSEAARPLWRPFTNGALGCLVLDDSPATLDLARFCGFEQRLPLVIAAGAASGQAVSSELLPAALRGAPAGVTVVNRDVAAAVRSLLLSAMQRPQGELADTSQPRARPAGELPQRF